MPDLPFPPRDPRQAGRIAAAFDREAKVLRAIESLVQLRGRRVTVLGAAPALQADIAARGAIVSVAQRAAPASDPGGHTATGLADGSADVVLAPWTGFDGSADAAELAESDRLLAPEGRLIVLQDYGRDDLTAVRGPESVDRLVARSRRDGWLLRSGFRVHVIHAWWRFADLDDARETLRAAFGVAAEPVIAALRKPAVAHNVAIYHRTRDGA